MSEEQKPLLRVVEREGLYRIQKRYEYPDPFTKEKKEEWGFVNKRGIFTCGGRYGEEFETRDLNQARVLCAALDHQERREYERKQRSKKEWTPVITTN